MSGLKFQNFKFHRHCEEQSDEAILWYPGDCFSPMSLAMTGKNEIHYFSDRHSLAIATETPGLKNNIFIPSIMK